MDLLPVITFLRRHHTTAANPATIEEVAVAHGIDLDAPFSYREVAELSAALATCPYVSRTRPDGERWAKYHASMYRPYSRSPHDKLALPEEPLS